MALRVNLVVIVVSSILILGVFLNLTPSVSGLTDEEYHKAITKCKEILPYQVSQEILDECVFDMAVQSDQNKECYYSHHGTLTQDGFCECEAGWKGNSCTIPNDSTDLPPWIKNNADWWAKGLISDSEFASGIAFMIKENIIKVESVEVDSEGVITIDNELGIPKWIQINARWWADGEISDDDFISGIQFMVTEEIISFTEKPHVITSEIYINM